MGNIDINTIRKKGFQEGSDLAKVEEYCRTYASEHTDGLIEMYNKLVQSREGKYINSDLMKMIFPFYAKSMENRKKYNMAVTNSAAVLTNETYRRAVENEEVHNCIYVLGPYGAGKSYFSQSLFESGNDELLKDCIIYEGSATPPAFEEKIEYAISKGVKPHIIVLNPTLKLSIENIKERAKKVGRDVEKQEVIDKFAGLYNHLKRVIEKFEGISYTIYNKTRNTPIDLNGGSKDIENLNHGSAEEIGRQYDLIIEKLADQPCL